MQPVSDAPAWTLSHKEGIGRVIIASRDLKPWEAVLEDRAIVMAPGNKPVCLSCLGPLGGENCVPCPGCKWPLCRMECIEEKQHQGECEVFKSRNIVPRVDNYDADHGLYSMVSVLRVLLLKQEVKTWEMIGQMMDQWEERSKDDHVVEGTAKMADFFQTGCGLDWVELVDVQHCYGVLKTNAVQLSGVSDGLAIYPLACVLSHSCVANIEPVRDPSDTICFRAKRRILKGEELSMRYTNFLDSKQNLQARLQKEWFFLCCCPRCLDPGEMGSHFSSLMCKCGGYFLKQTNAMLTHSACLLCKEWLDEEKSRMCEEKQGENVDFEGSLTQAREGGCHENHYITTKLYMKFLENNQGSNDTDILHKVVSRAQTVISTLSLVDSGCTRTTGKYLMILFNACHRLVMAKKQEMGEQQLRVELAEVVRGKIRAAKMMSSFTIRG